MDHYEKLVVKQFCAENKFVYSTLKADGLCLYYALYAAENDIQPADYESLWTPDSAQVLNYVAALGEKLGELVNSVSCTGELRGLLYDWYLRFVTSAFKGNDEFFDSTPNYKNALVAFDVVKHQRWEDAAMRVKNPKVHAAFIGTVLEAYIAVADGDSSIGRIIILCAEHGNTEHLKRSIAGIENGTHSASDFVRVANIQLSPHFAERGKTVFLVYFTGVRHYDVIHIAQLNIPTALQRRIDAFAVSSAEARMTNTYPDSFVDLQTSTFNVNTSRQRAKGVIGRHLSQHQTKALAEIKIMRKQQRDFNAEESGTGYLLLYIYLLSCH